MPRRTEEPLVAPDRVIERLDVKPVTAWQLRWRDIEGVTYAPDFYDDEFYDQSDRSYVRLEWASEAPTFTGQIRAVRLKPNFAYQMKLMGCTGVKGPESKERWASQQLGMQGRWWRDDSETALADREAREAIARGETVRGLILFDFFITDEFGGGEKAFALDSSYHVLWRRDQRRPHRTDSPLVRHDVVRGDWGYPQNAPEGATIAIFAEKEEPRPRPGNIRLPPGDYHVLFNITEESFHANQKRAVPLGGYWAQVLESDIQFTIGD